MTFFVVLGWVLGGLIFLLAAVLFLPVSVSVKFKEDFFVKVKFLGIKVFAWSSEKPEKTEKTEKAPTSHQAQEKKSDKIDIKAIFTRLKEKYGFSGAVKEVLSLALSVLSHIKRLLRHIKIKAIRLNLIYGSGDAAETAIDYGKICSAVYPVLALLDTCRNIDFKQINVQSDFTEKKTDFDFSLKVKMQIFFLLIAAFKVARTFKLEPALKGGF